MKKGWEMRKLGAICEISTGNANTEDAIENGEFAFFDRSKTIKRSSSYLFDCEAIIIAGEGQTFLPKFYSGKFNLHQRAYAIYNFNKNVDIQYVNNYLIHFHKYFEQVAVGATVKSLRLRHFQELPIPIPPRPEQQRIVSILDEAFAAIAKAKANAEQNLKNAKELFESFMRGVFENKGESWEEKYLGEMIEIKNGKNQQAVLSENGKYKVMGSAGNLMGYATDFICEAGTTIIGRKGNISKPIYINERFWNVDTAFGFYPKNEKDMDKRFIYYLCLGIDFKSMNRGTTIPSLVKSELQTIQISFPKSLKAQQAIVQKLDAVSAETKKLEGIYQQKINDLEELKKSVLQKAFSGELRGGEPVEPKTNALAV